MAVAISLRTLLISSLALILLAAQEAPKLEKHPISGLPRIKIAVASESFTFEIADDSWERARGLGGRERLGKNEGMIFVYARPEILGYWMKNCLIDIDIVYVRADGRIMAVHRMKKEPPRREGEFLSAYEARLPRYSSKHNVQFALEFPAGTIDRLKLKTGQRLVLPREELLKDAR